MLSYSFCRKTLLVVSIVVLAFSISVPVRAFYNPETASIMKCASTPGLCLPGAKELVTLQCSFDLHLNSSATSSIRTITCNITNNTNQTLTDEYRINFTTDYIYDGETEMMHWDNSQNLAGLEPGKTITKTSQIAITLTPIIDFYADGAFVSKGRSKYDVAMLTPYWTVEPYNPRCDGDDLNSNGISDAIEATAAFTRANQTGTLQVAPGKLIKFAAGLVGHNIEISGTGETYQEEVQSANGSGTSYWILGRTPDNQTVHWYDFTFDGETGARLVDGNLVLCFVDGKRGDTDLTANGYIEYVGGVATQQQNALYFPVPFPAEGTAVRLIIMEQGLEDNQTRLTFFDQDGETIDQRILDISGRGMLTVDDIPEATSLIMVEGYLLTGYATFTSPGGKTYAVGSATEFSEELIIPQEITTEAIDTYVTIINSGDVYAPVDLKDEPQGTNVSYLGVRAHSSKTYHVEAGKETTSISVRYAQTKVAAAILYRVDGIGWSMASLNSKGSATKTFPAYSQETSWTAYLGASSEHCSSTIYSAAGEQVLSESIPTYHLNEYFLGSIKAYAPSAGAWAVVKDGTSERPGQGFATIITGGISGGIGAYTPQGTKERGVIPLLPKSEGVTVCNLINPNSEPSDVSVQGYTTTGDFVGGGVLTIPANGSISIPIADPGNIASILFIAIAHPISGNQIFKYNSGSISTIPLLGGF